MRGLGGVQKTAIDAKILMAAWIAGPIYERRIQLLWVFIVSPKFIGKVPQDRCLRRGVRSDAQLSSTETRFQKCSQSGKNDSKHPILSISMAFNVISCKKVERNTQKLKIADFTM